MSEVRLTGLVADIETNGLMRHMIKPGEDKQEVSKLHIIGIRDIETNEHWEFCDSLSGYRPLSEGLSMLEQADITYWHNGIGYDIPVLELLYPGFSIHRKGVVDTQLTAQTIFPRSLLTKMDFGKINANKNYLLPPKEAGSHSLHAWGLRLGNEKIEFGKEEESVWEVCTQEMLDYCIQDVAVTADLARTLFDNDLLSLQALRIEHDLAWELALMERNGFPFDEDKCLELRPVIENKIKDKEEQIKKHVKPKLINKAHYKPKFSNPSKQVTVPKTSSKKQGKLAGAAYCPVTFVPEKTELKISSRKWMADYLVSEFGWDDYDTKVSEKTQQRNIVFDKDALDSLKGRWPFIEDLIDYYEAQALHGKIYKSKTGTGKPWITLSKDGVIHGRISQNSTTTGRATHSSPNLSQVPKAGKFLGEECRSMFTAPYGWYLVGSDAAGLELRCLANCLAPYDGGAYGSNFELDENGEKKGDVHTINMEAMGAPSRGIGKSGTYCWLYGGGDIKMGQSITEGYISPRDARIKGKKAKKGLEAGITGIKDMLRDLKQEFRTNGGMIKSIDGRSIYVNSEHKIINYKMQPMGSIICKRWLTRCCWKLREITGGDKDWKLHGFFHDEGQWSFKDLKLAEQFADISRQCMFDTREELGVDVPLDTDTSKPGRDWNDTH